MEIIGGLDVHRKQITFDRLVEIHTGEVAAASNSSVNPTCATLAEVSS